MSESLKETLQQDLNDARRARDKMRTLVLSTTLSEVRNKEIEAGTVLDDDGVRQVLTKAIKLRKDASSQMRDGGRADLADNEDAQAKILRAYLPPELSPEDVRELVRRIVGGGADQMGMVMAQLMPEIRGRFDGKLANQIVREELG